MRSFSPMTELIDINKALERLQELLGKKVTLQQATPEQNDVKEATSTCIRVHAEEQTRDQISYDLLREESLLDKKGVTFCPWDAVTGYPSHYIGKANKRRAQPFFDRLFDDRPWDFFCLHDPNDHNITCLFVPTAQFEAFLMVINEALGTALVIPEGVNGERFRLRFGQGSTPEPRWMERAVRKAPTIAENAPQAIEKDCEAFKSASPLDQDAWLSNWQKAIKVHVSTKSRSEINKQKNKHMLQQARRYLNLDGEYSESAVFISIDVEAIEVAPNPVSEIGVAVFEPDKIFQNKNSGVSGQSWWPLMKHYHFRVKEYAGLVNYRYVLGCPENFDFGSSCFPSKSELVDTLKTALSQYANTKRDVILVGHDIQADIQHLSKIGFDLTQLPRLICTIDTQAMHKAWKDSSRACSLGRILSELHIASNHLHNAGNDAAYTLRAMVAMALADYDPDPVVPGQKT